jgi:hypothetical protein
MKTTTQKFFAELNKRKPSKINLSLMSDLSSAVEDMRSYDLEGKYNTAITEYNNALTLLDNTRIAADKYVTDYSEFETASVEFWDSYQKARDIYFEITNQLQDLGVNESPEISNFGNEIADGEAAGQKSFDQTQNEFNDHNELVDISNFN